ncbi:hypothetical protein CTI12_AA239390 [Artemisia annua]|uniref:Rapid ALkalinization Factor n=1 Tax=Artemisia annua TaxID=35608 RepID=A0A2U1M8X4_ARTAN|nr:hypothetical protein CTI12_AA377470 [Artemisia annua]PWA75959.1 hypothetical protein CTI12_AA239390 [Artemisia annua]
MGQKMDVAVLILICGVLLVSSDEAQPPHFRSAHGNPTRSPPKYADSPRPPTTHTPSKGPVNHRIAYGALNPVHPACNAGINGACGANKYNVNNRNCTLYSNCRSG